MSTKNLTKESCKWKKKVATFGRNTGRFLLHIARFGTLLIANSEEILAVIPN
jgi:peptide subunit release factor 1 (eRF1)